MFTRHQLVRFKHCDPAGIVFYPRYFEIINDTVEDFFAQVLGYDFAEFIPENGVPTVAIETEFMAPSRHGDALQIEVRIKKIGRTSLTLLHAARCGTEGRFAAEHVLVHVDAAGRPSPWPAPVARKMTEYLEGMTP